MYGGLQEYNKLNLKNEFNKSDVYQTMIETKNDNLLNDKQIKTNSLLNETKILNAKNQNTNYLIEYFEGIILNYINMYEYRGENVNKLKKIILNNNNTNTKIETSKNIEPSNIVGGDNYDFIINCEESIIIKINKNTNNKIYKIYITNNPIKYLSKGTKTDFDDFYLEIDLQNNRIVAKVQRAYNNNIINYNCSIYNNNNYNNNDEKEIILLLNKLIMKLIICDYKNYVNGPKFAGYKYNGENIDLYLSDAYILIKSTIPLLIMILTLRTNIDKNIYTNYSYAYLLSGICKFNLFEDNVYEDPLDKFIQKFGGNNINILTYGSVKPKKLFTLFNNSNNSNNTNSSRKNDMNYIENSEYMCFEGDCIFNSLMCVRKPEIRELLVDRMGIVLNKDIEQYKNNKYYYNKIINILNELYNDVTMKWCIEIKNYIDGYNTFVEDISGNNYQLLIRNIKIFNLLLFSEKIVNMYNNLSENIDKYINIKNCINNFDNTDDLFKDTIKLIDTNINIIKHNYNNNNSQYFNNMKNGIYNLILYIKNIINKININEINTVMNNKDIIINKTILLLKFCCKYIYVLINNLIDYNLSDNEYNQINYFMKTFIELEKNKSYNINNILDNFDTLTNCVNIFDNFIKKYRNSLNIFYINLSISLLLVKHKVNHLFDDDIMDILKHSKDKTNIIKCFRQVENNRNEDLVFPAYQEGYNGEKYLFVVTSLTDTPHSLVGIINIDKNNKKYIYLLDINTLTIYCSDEFNVKNYKSGANRKRNYNINNINKRWIVKYYQNKNAYYYNRNTIEISFGPTKFLENWNNQPLTNIVLHYNLIEANNLTNIQIINEYINLFEKEYSFYNNNEFKQIYINIKREIFKDLLNYCDRNNSKPFIKYIQISIIDMINDDKCTIKKLLFKFIKCLIKAKYIMEHQNNINLNNLNSINFNNINLNNEYIIAANCFTDTYRLNIQDFINYLNFNNNFNNFTFNNNFNFNNFTFNNFTFNNNELNINELNNIINNIINILSFDMKRNNIIVRGGNTNISCCNNSIIKKVLIILLIILIIIIVVLIVLYIINKYKNNNNFK